MLITLGIIGVVAAMTIPTLIAHTNKIQYISKLKKAISTLSNAARMSSELYGYDYAGVNSPCSANAATDNPENIQSICALFNGTLKGATYHKGINDLPDYNINSPTVDGMDSIVNHKSRVPVYILQDGTMLIISNYYAVNPKPCTKIIGKSVTRDEAGYGNGCYGILDLNGVSLPNKETVCSSGTNTQAVESAGDCIVKTKDINDIFPIVFYDGMVQPYTSAGWAVLKNAK